jgi:hypothetical protein
MKNFLETFLKLTPLIAVVVAVVGWFIGNWLNAGRDQRNKQREIRLQYQIETYRRLALAVHRKPEPGSKYFRDLEAATVDIQLFGTESQIREVSAFLQQWKAKGRGDLDDLLKDLRNDLRRELRQPPVPGNVQWFRPEGAP